MLPRQTKFNEDVIKLRTDKQLYYYLIHSLGLKKLKTLKIYIKTDLKTKFIWHFKSAANISIFFNKKPDNSFWLYVNY